MVVDNKKKLQNHVLKAVLGGRGSNIIKYFLSSCYKFYATEEFLFAKK